MDRSAYLCSCFADELLRRRINTQLNRQESRHQLGAFGLMLNVVILWNTVYLQQVITESAPPASPPTPPRSRKNRSARLPRRPSRYRTFSWDRPARPPLCRSWTTNRSRIAGARSSRPKQNRATSAFRKPIVGSALTRTPGQPGSRSVKSCDSNTGFRRRSYRTPYCKGPHEWDGVTPPLSPEDERQLRRNRAAAESRRRRGPQEPGPHTRNWRPRNGSWQAAHGAGPVALLPVAQLDVRDVPLLRPPGQFRADVLQILWCPFDHPEHPTTVLFWRTASAVTETLNTPPEPPVTQFDAYLPEPCLLTPEEVTEYPSTMKLSKELREQLNDWSR